MADFLAWLIVAAIIGAAATFAGWALRWAASSVGNEQLLATFATALAWFGMVWLIRRVWRKV